MRRPPPEEPPTVSRRTTAGRPAPRPGSRPVACTATAARCLRRSGRTRRSALDRWSPLMILAVGDAPRTAMRRAVARQRPPQADWFASFHGASRPSRHTATALPATGLATDSRTAAYGIGRAVGLSRIALRVHWPDDALGGWPSGYGRLGVARTARTGAGAARRRISRDRIRCPRRPAS